MCHFNIYFFPRSNAVFTSDKSPFLKVLTDAEVAANAAAIQLVSFKDAMEDEFDVGFIPSLLQSKATFLN